MQRTVYAFALMTSLAMVCKGAVAETAQPPPNAPATAAWNAGKKSVTLRYHGSVILEASLCAEDAAGKAVTGVEIKMEPTETNGEKVEQRLKFALATPREGMKLVLSGTATGSAEAFPAETPGEAQKRFPLVRNSVGMSRNLRNNALYDRRWDWMLEGPSDGATRLQPKAADKQGLSFTWESRGATLELVFRPRYYQKHKELANFEPWTYKVWKGPVTGYCTWWAYREGFNQSTLDKLVDVFAEKKLPDFGYQYIQLDDAYQTGWGGCPTNWLSWNGKFPGGAEYAVKKIKAGGMKPGIWVNRLHRPCDPHVTDIGKQHPEWFIQKPDGGLTINGSYHSFYVLNTQNKEALEGMVRPTYRALKAQGWDYVKIDAAGDLLYASENQQCAAYYKKIGLTPKESLRIWDQVAREVLGPKIYILTCWGVYPGICSIGLADGCRLSDDGFGPATFQRFSSWNGVVWRGDPDHCDIMAKAFEKKTTMKVFGASAAMADTIDQPAIVAMAGGALMVSDPVEHYQDDSNLEGMKRSSPVLFTVPGQLYDYGNRATQDYSAAKRGGECTWWLQEIDRPFEHWSVLARFNWRQEKLKWDRAGMPETDVKFVDLGLADDREYLVFEFWTQTFLGKAKGAFKAPAQDVNGAMQLFAIREARPHPWVLSTTRHVSQGGVDLLDVRWDANKKILSGKSDVVAGDPYVLTVHLPRGFTLKGAEVSGEKAEIAGKQEIITVRTMPSATKPVQWAIRFSK